MSQLKAAVEKAIMIGPMSELQQRINDAISPFERGMECLEEFRRMLDEGFVLTGPDILRVLRLIAKTDGVLIPLKGVRNAQGLE